MFGCTAVYVDDKIMLILRERDSYPLDNGVWLATAPEHHESLRRELPMMRSIGLFGKKPTAWQLLPADHAQLEEAARRVCELVLKRDARIGKVPKRRAVVKPHARHGSGTKQAKTPRSATARR